MILGLCKTLHYRYKLFDLTKIKIKKKCKVKKIKMIDKN